MAEAATAVRLGQEVVLIPGTILDLLVDLIPALFPGLGVLHALLQPLLIRCHACDRPTPVGRRYCQLFSTQNVYFGSESSSLHWKSKLRNVWGQ